MLLSTGISANSTISSLQKEVFTGKVNHHEILMGELSIGAHKVIGNVFIS